MALKPNSVNVLDKGGNKNAIKRPDEEIRTGELSYAQYLSAPMAAAPSYAEYLSQPVPTAKKRIRQYAPTAPSTEPAPSAPTTYADYLKATRDGELKVAEDSYTKAIHSADITYEKMLPTYGVQGEQLRQMGLTGSGYSEYLAGEAMRGRNQAYNNALATRQLAQTQADTSYQTNLFAHQESERAKNEEKQASARRALADYEGINGYATPSVLDSLLQSGSITQEVYDEKMGDYKKQKPQALAELETIKQGVQNGQYATMAEVDAKLRGLFDTYHYPVTDEEREGAKAVFDTYNQGKSRDRLQSVLDGQGDDALAPNGGLEGFKAYSSLTDGAGNVTSQQPHFAYEMAKQIQDGNISLEDASAMLKNKAISIIDKCQDIAVAEMLARTVSYIAEVGGVKTMTDADLKEVTNRAQRRVMGLGDKQKTLVDYVGDGKQFSSWNNGVFTLSLNKTLYFATPDGGAISQQVQIGSAYPTDKYKTLNAMGKAKEGEIRKVGGKYYVYSGSSSWLEITKLTQEMKNYLDNAGIKKN